MPDDVVRGRLDADQLADGRGPDDGDDRDDGDDHEDFGAFVRRRGTHLIRFAYLLVGDVGRAEDLVQTALVKTWLRGAHVTAAGREAYVRRTMVTTVVSWWRRGGWRERPTSSFPDHSSFTSHVAAPDATAVVDERDVLLAALRRVPPRQRSAVVLRHYAALSEAETADVLRCSVGTVKSLTSRGLATLRALLAADSAAANSASTNSAVTGSTGIVMEGEIE